MMISFDNNEFEIAMVTYNRCAYVKEWLEHCYDKIEKRNIKLSIYDSSTNEETQDHIRIFNKEHVYKIDYKKVPSETTIGYKPMLPILESISKYVWVSGDSRYHDFDELDKKIFPHVKAGVDYILIGGAVTNEWDEKEFVDKSEFLQECFLSSTCIGLSIYKRDIFEQLKKDIQWMDLCDKKYRNNYGFGWLGYFYEVFAKQDYKAVCVKVNIDYINKNLKKHSWGDYWYKCWIEDLCDLIDEIPVVYSNKESIPKKVWKIQKFDTHNYCYSNRKNGYWNKEAFSKYPKRMYMRVTDNYWRMKFYSCAPVGLVECLHGLVGFSDAWQQKKLVYLVNKNMRTIINRIDDRELVIWGAWEGANIVKKALAKKSLWVKCYVDKCATSMGLYQGVPVVLPNAINVESHYVIVCTKKKYREIEEQLVERGYTPSDYIYLYMKKQ